MTRPIRESAREYFKNKGLDYSMLRKEEIEGLVNFIREELKDFKTTGGEDAKLMDLQVRKPRIKDIKVLMTGLEYANLHVKGSYFDRREAITFNKNGFIGFGGELSDKNVTPIIVAFKKWCDLLASYKEKDEPKICYLCENPIDKGSFIVEKGSQKEYYVHKSCDQQKPHRGCPNCHEDCMGWIVDGIPC
jgi:hypothetical protein